MLTSVLTLYEFFDFVLFFWFLFPNFCCVFILKFFFMTKTKNIYLNASNAAKELNARTIAKDGVN